MEAKCSDIYIHIRDTLHLRGLAMKHILVISYSWSGFSALRSPSTLATHSDSGQEPLRDIGHDDANKENDSLQPAIAQEKGDPKENNTKKDGH